MEVAARAPLERAGGNAALVGTRSRPLQQPSPLYELPGLHDRFEPRGERYGAGVSGQVPRRRLTAPPLISDAVVSS